MNNGYSLLFYIKIVMIKDVLIEKKLYFYLEWFYIEKVDLSVIVDF